MPEVAKLLVASKIINKVAKCSYIHEACPHLGQIYVFCYDGKVMLGAMNGVALAMRKIVYDEEGMAGVDMIEADERYQAALGVMGMDRWMFPADLKIPNGLNTTMTLYDDYSVVLQTKNAIYGPFYKVPMLDGTEFNVHRLYHYPPESVGSSRAVNPALMTKMIAAIGDKDNVLIINTSGEFDTPIYVKISTGDAYGMIMPIREPALADQGKGRPENDDDGEQED